MAYEYHTNPIKNTYAKAKSFLRGCLEGVILSFMMPTHKRLAEDFELYHGENRENGRATGMLLNLLGHGYLLASLPDDKAIYALIPIVASNLASGACEYARSRLKTLNNPSISLSYGRQTKERGK